MDDIIQKLIEFDRQCVEKVELAKKKKAEGLTAEEQEEQKVLYRAYIDAFKANLKAQLETIEIVDDDKKEVAKIESEVEELEETLEESEEKFN